MQGDPWSSILRNVISILFALPIEDEANMYTSKWAPPEYALAWTIEATSYADNWAVDIFLSETAIRTALAGLSDDERTRPHPLQDIELLDPSAFLVHVIADIVTAVQDFVRLIDGTLNDDKIKDLLQQ